MEWWKLFSGTFILIFLAELGDKTQLAAMAKTADSPDSSVAKWVVFLGASLALVTSTFIAVFLGSWLKSFIPDERYIRIAAAVLFLVFGCMILYEVYDSYRVEGTAVVSAEPEAGAADPGYLGRLALKAAMDFESYAAERYRRVAASAEPRLAALLLSLASEEEGHLSRLKGMPDECGPDAFSCPLPLERVDSGRFSSVGDSADIIRELIRHEKGTADFYRNLAERTLVPSVKVALSGLAAEEEGHARRLGEMIEQDDA